MTRDDLLQKVSAAIDETLYAYSHGLMSEDMAKESILAIADDWATDEDEILAHMEMLVRDYGAADDNSLTAGAKVLKRRVLVACAPLMNLTAVMDALREPSEGMLKAAPATRKYWPVPHREYVSVYYVAFDGPQDPENIGELFYSFKEAQAACDRLNLLAVLEAIREPSEGMEKAALLRYPNLGNGDVASIWYAMIDAAITEVKSDEHI